MTPFSNARRRSISTAAAAVAVSLLSGSYALGQTELLLNPGFEPGVAGSPTATTNVDKPMQNTPGGASVGPWKGYNNWVAPYSGYYTIAVAHSGVQAAKTFSGPNGGVYQTVAVSPGTDYTASAWFDNASFDALQFGETEQLNLDFFSSTGANLGTVVSANNLVPTSPTDTWTKSSVSAVAPPGAATVQWTAFFSDPYFNGGALFVDDGSLLNTNWNGGGTDNNWSTNNNWGGVAPSQYTPVVFAGTTRLNNNNDLLAGTPFYGISFLSDAGAFVLSGNQANVVSDIVNKSPNTQTIALNLGLQPDGSATNINFNTSAGNITVSGGISGVSSLTKLGTSTLTLSGSNNYVGATNVSAGSLVLASSGALAPGNALNISAGSTVSASNLGTSFALQVNTLSVGGKLDLNNNSIVIHTGTLSALNSQLQASYNNGTWTAPTGIVSTTASTDPAHLTALGVILNDNGSGSPLYGSGGTIAATFGGAVPVFGDILVKFTYYGDANLDGQVDGSDYTKIDAAFNNISLTGWANGDFNYDGKVDGSDYTLIDNAFNTQGARIAAIIAPAASSTSQISGSSAVPEPTTLALFGIGAAGLLGRRRR